MLKNIHSLYGEMIWMQELEERKDYMKRNYIPMNIDLSFENFVNFIGERKKLMTNKFKSVLKL